MSSITVLQARTSSSRLPAKVLLPIAGMPLAVLAARRAANSGRSVVVATSRSASDDALVQALQREGIACFRGSLDDVLERVVAALAGHSDATVVCRLTADNVFPDGPFLDEMERELRGGRLDYLSSNGPESGLPHGMSAELTLLGHLRAAARSTTDMGDREHVTPAVIRRFGRRVFARHAALGRSHDRCTVDCLDDYLRVHRVFDELADPVAVPSLTLIQRLGALPDAPLGARAVPALVLGGAQLGLEYGIANATGRPSGPQTDELIKTAVRNGVEYLDTARAYGESEAAIGRVVSQGWAGRFKVVSKLAPLADCPSGADAAGVAARVDASVYQSCAALRLARLDALLLHRAQHLEAWGGAAWSRLQQLQGAGVIGRLGVSVRNPAELAAALAQPAVQLVQLPFNILDRRWQQSLAALEAARAARGLTVHVRSALLQGLLPSDRAQLWRKAHVGDGTAVIGWIAAAVRDCRRASIADLCLAYVRAQGWVDGVVVGAEQPRQLEENIRSFLASPLTPAQCADLERARPAVPEATLDPSTWDTGRTP